jgi:hypothetical protein
MGFFMEDSGGVMIVAAIPEIRPCSSYYSSRALGRRSAMKTVMRRVKELVRGLIRPGARARR